MRHLSQQQRRNGKKKANGGNEVSRTYHEIVITRRGTDRRPRLAGSIRLEKVFEKYYTFYPEKSGHAEHAGETSYYLMIHENFANTHVIDQGSKVYRKRKRFKRHTFNSVRCFYENFGIGLRKKR
jgi:hypothetical protein